MALESLTGSSVFIDDLVNTNPVGATDPKSQGDDHLRGIKNVLLNSFPGVTGAVSSTHTELNLLDGITGISTSISADPDDSNTTLASAEAIWDLAGSINSADEAIPAGTAMVFAQASVPTGWTEAGGDTYSGFRVRASGSGDASPSSETGGSINYGAGVSVTGGTTLSAAQSGLPAHTHTLPNVNTSDNNSQVGRNDGSQSTTITATGAVTGGAASAASAHTHTITYAPKYTDVVIGSKDAY